MERAAGLQLGRTAHRERRWAEAFALLTEADADSPLAAGDLELAAEAADLSGRNDESVPLLRRAYQAHADAGDVRRALRSAY